uniref:Uncharacterized protein n=1 Tax=Cacopsylla melanoneura TaxID=428564 RepID=A0A8D9B7L6_9HEMI
MDQDFDDFAEYVNYVFDDAYEEYPPMERVVLRDQDNPLEALNDIEFVQRYHISKQSITGTILPLVDQRDIQDRRGAPIPVILKLLTFIRYLTSGSFQVSTLT